jgi:hypothetical protein
MITNGVIYRFRFTLKHGKGYVRIITTGESPQAARRKVILAEGCPLSAITKEEVQDGRKFVGFMQRVEKYGRTLSAGILRMWVELV